MVTYTGSSAYWQPLRPRIKIYAFSDTTYATPLYTYDPFTDVGSSTKPISLQFSSETTNAGTFALEIEDATSAIDPDTYLKGNRIVIDCSKDGVTYQPAFKGLVRAAEQNIYAISGKNITLQGYSYLIRLNERIINVQKQSSLTGTDYNRTDSTMFTNNLVNDLLSNNADYVYSSNDTSLYSVLKTNNISSSSLTDWIPRLDASLTSVNDAISSALEFSNGLIMVDFSNDQLMLYNPENASSATGIFLLTDQMNQSADDADITMYPIDPYKYAISYDYPDSGSRLIGSIGTAVCAAGTDTASDYLTDPYTSTLTLFNEGWSTQMNMPPGTQAKRLRMPLKCVGNCSSRSSLPVVISTYAYDGGTEYTVTLYRDSTLPATPFPSSTTTLFVVGMADTDLSGPVLSPGTTYYIKVYEVSGSTLANHLELIVDNTGSFRAHRYNANDGFGISFHTGSGSGSNYFRSAWGSVPSAECGGLPETVDADPVFAIAHDKNMSARIGVVEKVVSSIPPHVKTLQTMNEYLFNKLYTAAKPRFTFDFTNVTMPGKIPKSGDLVMHVSNKANVGLRGSPVQTGVVMSVNYDFAQGDDGVLGLRKLGLSTTGIKRGSY